MTQNIDYCLNALIKTCIAFSKYDQTSLRRYADASSKMQSRIEILAQPRYPVVKPASPEFSFTPAINHSGSRRKNTFENLYNEGVRLYRKREYYSYRKLEPLKPAMSATLMRSFDFSKKLYQSKTLRFDEHLEAFTPTILEKSRRLASERRKRELVELATNDHQIPQYPTVHIMESATPRLTYQQLSMFFERQRYAELRKHEHIAQQAYQLQGPHKPQISKISYILMRNRIAQYDYPRKQAHYKDPNETFYPKINEVSKAIAVKRAPYYDYKAQILIKKAKIEKLAAQFNREAELKPQSRPRSRARSVLRDPENICEYYKEKLRQKERRASDVRYQREAEEMSHCTFRPYIRYYPAAYVQ